MRRPSPTSAAPLGQPLFLLNLKAYPSSIGRRADTLLGLLEQASQEYGVPSALAPSLPDLGRLADRARLPVLAPHIDSRAAGAATGWVVPEAVAAAGAAGSLLNHSERPISPEEVARCVERLRALKLAAVVCARTPAEAGRLARERPPYLAIEPPELIGGKVSVSRARPEVITEAVLAVRAVSPRTSVLCGAGIHDRGDVRKALELGARGVLVASAVATSPRPKSALAELFRGF
ncbi:MAG: triose-phosphate isomerase [Thermoplasmata archaeon]|nr:triose-phosphate isomerase [Thermoplasmata archaeon]